MSLARSAVFCIALVLLSACSDGGSKLIPSILRRAPMPDELPVMRNPEPPFRYPAALFAQRVQGNVSLRLYVDGRGTVHAESTRVVQSSGNPSLDSAAMSGARELVFEPAKRKGVAMPVTIIFPVYFRHPEGEPLPGDTILKSGKRKGT